MTIISKTVKKTLVGITSIALALSLAFGSAANVSAQSMSLSQLVDLFVSLGIIPSNKVADAKAAVSKADPVVTFTRDLSVGSTGSDVTALQNKLGIIPASGYFGGLTKVAVQKFQSENGLPSSGYVGPLTRAKLNSGAPVVTSAPVVNPTPVVNTGVEGTLTVDKSSISNTTVREGDTMKPILGIKVEAKLSDINVQRVKLALGSASSIYTKVFKTLYVTDESGSVIAQADLNSNTVIKENSNYFITMGGFSLKVAKDSKRILYVKADLYSSIKNADQGTRSISVVSNGVRGVDGAGIDQYGPSSTLSQSVSVSSTLVDSAALRLSTNSVNPKAAEVVASAGTNNDELDGLSLISFDLSAEKDEVKLTDLTASISTSGSASVITAKLYRGSNLVASESVNAGTVTFSDMDESLSKDVAQRFSISVDVRNANATPSTVSASVSSVGVVAENSQGSSVPVSGSSVGELMSVRNVGPVFTLVTEPTITRSPISSNDTSGVATSTATGHFLVKVEAVGGAITMGGTGSTTPSFDTSLISVFKNGSSIGSPANAVVSYSVPSSGVVVTDSGNTFTVQQNNSVVVDVTFLMTVSDNATNNFAFQLNGIKWFTPSTGTTVSNFMANKSEWRTGSVTLP